jgi:hypothetical protein
LTETEERWVTYAEAGELLGISTEAARQLARRRGWPRRTPNERGAVAHVQVPADLGTVRLAVRPRPVVNGGRTPVVPGTNSSDERPDSVPDVLRTVRETVELLLAPLREQLDHERARADRAEQRIDELQTALTTERRRVIEILTAPWWRRWFR